MRTMSNGGAGDTPDEREAAESPEASADRLAVRGPDERGAAVQLAARWAELYPSPGTTDDRAGLLARFRTTHAFIDAVIHGIEPPSTHQ